MGVCTDFKAAVELLAKQEEILQFPHFNSEDAWALGCIMVEEVKKRGIDLCISIRKLNGHYMFAWTTDGTCVNNQQWMQRKFNVVKYFEMSSLRQTADAHLSGQIATTHGLSFEDHVLVGGGFPVRVNGAMSHIITVSNLPHEQDHAFIVDCICKYLGVECPQLDCEIPLPKETFFD